MEWTEDALEQKGFMSRREAGRVLGCALQKSGVELPGDSTVVVGLARGGVDVAAEVASALHARLDALAVRKVGHPWQPEYGVGAVAPGGVRFIRSSDGLTEAQIADAVAAAAENADRLDARLHEKVGRAPIEGSTCVLVDDGLATGGTMVAAVRWARAHGAGRVVVAVPVGSRSAVEALERDADVDAVLCLVAPPNFGAVGFWYADFRQVSDDDVVALLVASSAEPESFAEELVIGGVRLAADLVVPAQTIGWVVFAHGSGSSRRSPRNVAVACGLNRAGMATMLFDLLSPAEERDRRNVFDVELLARRLVAATDWLAGRSDVRARPIGYFGASTGAAAGLIAAAELGEDVAAVVSRGGRPDLAGNRLPDVRAPTLLIVGERDEQVLELNREAAGRLACTHELAIVAGATHLFEEPGALEQVATLASSWFATWLPRAAARGTRKEVEEWLRQP